MNAEWSVPWRMIGLINKDDTRAERILKGTLVGAAGGAAVGAPMGSRVRERWERVQGWQLGVVATEAETGVTVTKAF